MSDERGIVLITGSGGRIGTELAGRIARRYRVVGLDHRPGGCASAAVDCIPVDLSNAEEVTEALEQVRAAHGERLASVVHLAGHYNFAVERDRKTEAINVGGTQRLFTALRPFQVEQFV